MSDGNSGNERSESSTPNNIDEDSIFSEAPHSRVKTTRWWNRIQDREWEFLSKLILAVVTFVLGVAGTLTIQHLTRQSTVTAPNPIRQLVGSYELLAWAPTQDSSLPRNIDARHGFITIDTNSATWGFVLRDRASDWSALVQCAAILDTTMDPIGLRSVPMNYSTLGYSVAYSIDDIPDMENQLDGASGEIELALCGSQRSSNLVDDFVVSAMNFDESERMLTMRNSQVTLSWVEQGDRLSPAERYGQ